MPFKRGAPLGNKNRLTHGRTTRVALARRAVIHARRKSVRNLLVRATIVFKARAALQRKKSRALQSNRDVMARQVRATPVILTRCPKGRVRAEAQKHREDFHAEPRRRGRAGPIAEESARFRRSPWRAKRAGQFHSVAIYQVCADPSAHSAPLRAKPSQTQCIRKHAIFRVIRGSA